MTGFARRTDAEDVGVALRWRGPRKIAVIHALTQILLNAGVNTVEDLRRQIDTPESGRTLAGQMRGIKHVGPKTVDYIAILVGGTDRVAVDVHVRRFAEDAGLKHVSYAELRRVLPEAARRRGWDAAALDGAIWSYMPEASAQERVRPRASVTLSAK